MERLFRDRPDGTQARIEEGPAKGRPLKHVGGTDGGRRVARFKEANDVVDRGQKPRRQRNFIGSERAEIGGDRRQAGANGPMERPVAPRKRRIEGGVSGQKEF
jgi:hypothetical protein